MLLSQSCKSIENSIFEAGDSKSMISKLIHSEIIRVTLLKVMGKSMMLFSAPGFALLFNDYQSGKPFDWTLNSSLLRCIGHLLIFMLHSSYLNS